MEILDFESCDYSSRNGYYGGAAGDKDGIVLFGEPWICKFPKPTIGMSDAKSLSPYALTPLSEYLGSHIYQILGFPVHETILGLRDGFLVVGCKDFCREDERLFEIRTLKNIHLSEMKEQLGIDLHETGDDHMVDLRELFVHFSNNPEMQNVAGLEERFWDQMVIDGFIGNNDRNNGNWGIIIGTKTKRIAPIFDNGAAFYPKKGDYMIKKALLLSKEERQRNYLNVITPFTLDGEHHLNYTAILSMDKDDLPEQHLGLLHESMRRVVRLVEAKLDEIKGLFDDLPLEYSGVEVLSEERKKYYLESFLTRYEYLRLKTQG